MMVPLIWMKTSLILLERLTRENGRCPYGAECSSRRWMVWREAGLTDYQTVVSTTGRTCRRSLWKAFMSNSKCPELARRFSNQVPKMVTEMIRRVDYFVISEEAYKSTELPKGEHPEKGQGTFYRISRPPRAIYRGGNRGWITITTSTAGIIISRMSLRGQTIGDMMPGGRKLIISASIA
ncbi:hypothetical protein Tco_1142968 [Tanacetum coccineum]